MARFSANLGFLWGELPLLERIERAAAAGFLAIELHWPYETSAQAVRDACARHGLELLGINTPVGDASIKLYVPTEVSTDFSAPTPPTGL